MMDCIKLDYETDNTQYVRFYVYIPYSWVCLLWRMFDSYLFIIEILFWNM